jgi:hypothetical protein
VTPAERETPGIALMRGRKDFVAAWLRPGLDVAHNGCHDNVARARTGVDAGGCAKPLALPASRYGHNFDPGGHKSEHAGHSDLGSLMGCNADEVPRRFVEDEEQARIVHGSERLKRPGQ